MRSPVPYKRSRRETPLLCNDGGLALSALGHHNEATAYFTRTLELKSSARSALVNRANTGDRMQPHAQAIAGYGARERGAGPEPGRRATFRQGAIAPRSDVENQGEHGYRS